MNPKTLAAAAASALAAGVTGVAVNDVFQK